jgi:hypothetical protein
LLHAWGVLVRKITFCNHWVPNDVALREKNCQIQNDEDPTELQEISTARNNSTYPKKGDIHIALLLKDMTAKIESWHMPIDMLQQNLSTNRLPKKQPKKIYQQLKLGKCQLVLSCILLNQEVLQRHKLQLKDTLIDSTR